MGSPSEWKGQRKISQLEDGTIELIQLEQKRENRQGDNEQSLRDVWDRNKRWNIHITGVS